MMAIPFEEFEQSNSRIGLVTRANARVPLSTAMLIASVL